MCGIVGAYSLGDRTELLSARVAAMARTITHRGPDEAGHYDGDRLALGFRRLSIIDLATGSQPMSDGAEQTWVVFNGEIYNFRELRTDLERLGFRFRTNSDTEVIVHGYNAWGTALFSRLNAMFAIAIWDNRDGRLIVARDRMGIKLAYYSVEPGAFVFASEMRAIVETRDGGSAVDPEAVALFLQLRYTPSPLTIERGIRKLPPGGMAVVQGDDVSEMSWYDAGVASPPREPALGAARERLRTLYSDSVRRQLMSDVPLGLLLSGGVDSALLLALMHENGFRGPTFSVGYGPEYANDELADARRTAAWFGVANHQVRLSPADFEETLDTVVGFLEEPIASSSIVPMYHVCELARRHVKVVLLGQGPDELFGGYNRHHGEYYGWAWRTLPSGMRGLVGRALTRLSSREAVRRSVEALGTGDRTARHRRVLSLAPAATISDLTGGAVSVDTLSAHVERAWGATEAATGALDDLGALQAIEVRSTLPDELLMYADKLSMAHSLEARVPYLDQHIVDYASGLRAGLKIRGRTRKRVHRAVASELIPREIIRRRKRGFAVDVVKEWFAESVETALVGRLRDSRRAVFQLLDYARVQALIDDHRAGTADNHKLIASVVFLDRWLSMRRNTPAMNPVSM